jgi:hypothetical protein
LAGPPVPEPGWPVPVLYLSSIKPVSMDMGLVQYRYWPVRAIRAQPGWLKYSSKMTSFWAIFGALLRALLSTYWAVCPLHYYTFE